MANNEAVILQGFCNGSIEAFEWIFKKYYRWLWMEAYHFIGNENDAHDIVQSLFMHIWEGKLYRNIDTSRIKNYLYGAVRNECFLKMRNDKIKSHALSNYANLKDKLDEKIGIENRQLGETLQEALDDLPPQRKEVFLLVYVKKLKYEQAAGQLGISVNSVKTHLKLALKTLRYKLKKII